MATARKIAAIFYTMVTNQVEYDEGVWARMDAGREARYEAKLKRMAERRGFVIVPKASLPITQNA